MTFNRRILKTGALAVAVTIAFAIFAYRVAEWSNGINSEMAVLREGPLAGNPCPIQSVKIIPQMAMGSFDGGLTKYSTAIQLVNTSGSSQTVAANFYARDGETLSNVSLTAGASSITNGVLSPTSIAQDSVLVISGGGTTAPGTLGWGKITACGSLTLSTFFELRDGKTDVLYSRVAVAASPANMSSFVIPRIRDVAAGLDVGFALVNTGSSEATLKAELKDATGKMIAAKDIIMKAGAHQTAFTDQLFGGLIESTGKRYQYLKFSSASPTFAATAFAFEGPTQTSFPVDALQ
jgi:hypothetical protein